MILIQAVKSSKSVCKYIQSKQSVQTMTPVRITILPLFFSSNGQQRSSAERSKNGPHCWHTCYQPNDWTKRISAAAPSAIDQLYPLFLIAPATCSDPAWGCQHGAGQTESKKCNTGSSPRLTAVCFQYSWSFTYMKKRKAESINQSVPMSKVVHVTPIAINGVILVTTMRFFSDLYYVELAWPHLYHSFISIATLFPGISHTMLQDHTILCLLPDAFSRASAT